MSAQHVRELCDRWDALSKGPSPTTIAVLAALNEPDESRADPPPPPERPDPLPNPVIPSLEN